MFVGKPLLPVQEEPPPRPAWLPLLSQWPGPLMDVAYGQKLLDYVSRPGIWNIFSTLHTQAPPLLQASAGLYFRLPIDWDPWSFVRAPSGFARVQALPSQDVISEAAALQTMVDDANTALAAMEEE